jgi:hypothetical protein
MRTRQIVLLLLGLALLVFAVAWFAVSLLPSQGLSLSLNAIPLEPLIPLAGSILAFGLALRGAGGDSDPLETRLDEYGRRSRREMPPADDFGGMADYAPPEMAEELPLESEPPPVPQPAPARRPPLEPLTIDSEDRRMSDILSGIDDAMLGDSVEPALQDALAEEAEPEPKEAKKRSAAEPSRPPTWRSPRSIPRMEPAAPSTPPTSYADAKTRILKRIEDSGWEALAGDDPAEKRAMIKELFGVMLAEENVVLARNERAALFEQIAAEVLGEVNVLFSAYYPREVKPQDWQPLRAYIFKDFARGMVVRDADEHLGDRADIRATERPAQQTVAEGAMIVATPEAAGLEFNPPFAPVRFRRDWHAFDFEFQAVDAPLDTSANGRITFTVEGVIVADVPLSIYVTETLVSAAPEPVRATAAPYEAIFCSYSHADTTIVERVEAAYKALGIDYLRDVTTLRAGSHWGPELIGLIERADIFQLFWSTHAAESQYVTQEWAHALKLIAQQAKDEHFIRPVRWEEPMPDPPDALSHIHFAYRPELGQ